jgi:hypothetical protein
VIRSSRERVSNIPCVHESLTSVTTARSSGVTGGTEAAKARPCSRSASKPASSSERSTARRFFIEST